MINLSLRMTISFLYSLMPGTPSFVVLTDRVLLPPAINDVAAVPMMSAMVSNPALGTLRAKMNLPFQLPLLLTHNRLHSQQRVLRKSLHKNQLNRLHSQLRDLRKILHKKQPLNLQPKPMMLCSHHLRCRRLQCSSYCALNPCPIWTNHVRLQ